MAELIHQFSAPLQRNGAQYLVRVYGDERDDGTWEGWIEFQPVGPDGSVLRTERETSQPTREALAYWAGGLEPVFLEGAAQRAR
jgi:hypothetical protein